MDASEHRPRTNKTILIVGVLVVASLIAVSVFLFSSSPSNLPCDALYCDSLVVRFNMTATRASNGSLLFDGVITNDGRDPATGMRILVNGTGFGGNWTTTFTPGFPSPAAPLASGGTVAFHARLGAGAPPAWPVACQSFRCLAGEKLLVEIDLFGSNTNLADSETYITIGSE
jgi:hypothetical protein